MHDLKGIHCYFWCSLEAPLQFAPPPTYEQCTAILHQHFPAKFSEKLWVECLPKNERNLSRIYAKTSGSTRKLPRFCGCFQKSAKLVESSWVCSGRCSPFCMGNEIELVQRFHSFKTILRQYFPSKRWSDWEREWENSFILHKKYLFCCFFVEKKNDHSTCQRKFPF